MENSKKSDYESSTTKTPLVYWSQTEQQITLKIDLKDSQEPSIHFTNKTIKFSAKAHGACGFNAYNFTLNYYADINEEDCYYRVFANKIDIILKKSVENWWPRLVATPQKPHWLKIDFDRWCTEDDMLLEEEEKQRDVMQDYSEAYKLLQKEEFGYIKENSKKVYLVFYNLAQFIGYCYVLCVLGILYMRDSSAVVGKAYENVGNVMKFCQLLQYLEVLHPIFGYTKGSPIMPFFQVSGRNFILFIMIEMESRMQTKPVVCYVFVIWSLIEIVRYPYYITQLLQFEVGFLSWLRYTLWIPLYPMGIICEGIIILRNIPYFEETQRFSVDMPNMWNFTFDMPLFMKCYLFLLILPGSYMVMTHMAKVRAKKLRSNTSRRLKSH